MESQTPENGSLEGDASSPRADDLLVVFLADQESPCPLCGYNLRGLRSPMCPECGAALRLQVGLADPRLGAFILLLVALGLGFGGSTLMGLIALKEAPSNWWGKASAVVLILQWLWTGVCLPVSIAMRRSYRRLSPTSQWLIAAGALLTVLIGSFLIVALFDD